MDKKSKIFFLIFFLLIVGSVAVTYWRIMVKRDYIISAQVDCDPATEACFASACDPESNTECAATPEAERTTYYKLISKNAENIPPCDPYKDECPKDLSCDPGEKDCEISLCDSSNVPDGEECNDPAKYVEENPPCDCSKAGDENANDNSEAADSTEESNANDNSSADESAEQDNTNSSDEEGVSNDNSDSGGEQTKCDCSKVAGSGDEEDNNNANDNSDTSEQ